jgi:hypothetical protein
MNAMLVTRCNCERKMVITYPPPRHIVVPIRTQNSLFHLRHTADDDLTKPSFGRRVFELKEHNGNEAVYIEKSECWTR